jgi:hypothetical protein
MRIAASLGQLASAALLSLVAYHTTCAAHDLHYHDSFVSRINWQKVEPYVGADAFVRNMRYKDEPTHPFQENLDTFQPFVGVKLNRYFGVEVGYQRSEKGTKERFFNQNESPSFFGGGPLTLNGGPGPTNYTLDIMTTNMVRGWNFGVLGFYPICPKTTDLYLKVGYSKLRQDAEVRFSAVEESLGVFAVAANDYHHFHDKAGMLSLSLGLKQKFTHNLGGRVFINFDKTSRLKDHSDSLLLQTMSTAQASSRGGSLDVRTHNSWGVGVGLFYSWQ